MFPMNGGQDYLDSLFGRQRVARGHQSPIASKLPNLQRSNLKNGGGGMTYADKIRSKVDSVKRHKKKRKSIMSSRSEPALDIGNTNDNISPARQDLLSNTAPDCYPNSVVADCKNIPAIQADSNQLRIHISEFGRCSALLESFNQQLEFFISSFHRSESQFYLKQDELASRSTDEDYSIEREQFFSLIIALRKSSMRVAECYQKTADLFQNDKSQPTVVALKIIRKQLTKMVEKPRLNFFSKPFSSWIVVSSHRNPFFMQKKMDGTSAVESSCEKRNIKDFFSFENLNSNDYPKELMITKEELVRIERLSALIWVAVKTYLSEEENVRKEEREGGFLTAANSTDNSSDEESNRGRGNSTMSMDCSAPSYSGKWGESLRSKSTLDIIEGVEGVEKTSIALTSAVKLVLLRAAVSAWKKAYSFQLRISGVVKCRNQGIKKKVLDFLLQCVWWGARGRALADSRRCRALCSVFEAWKSRYAWCLRFNAVHAKANKQRLRFFFLQLANVCRSCFETRDFKRSVGQLYLKSSFRCMQTSILLERFKTDNNIRYKTVLNFKERYFDMRFYFERWLKHRKLGAVFLHLDAVKELWQLRDRFRMWKKLCVRSESAPLSASPPTSSSSPLQQASHGIEAAHRSAELDLDTSGVFALAEFSQNFSTAFSAAKNLRSKKVAFFIEKLFTPSGKEIEVKRGEHFAGKIESAAASAPISPPLGDKEKDGKGVSDEKSPSEKEKMAKERTRIEKQKQRRSSILKLRVDKEVIRRERSQRRRARMSKAINCQISIAANKDYRS